jgi:hypothetical protein
VSDISLDKHGSTIDDLLMEMSMARVDKLADRFRKSAMKARPIKAVEVMMAALQIMGEGALGIIPNSDQRKAICAAMIWRILDEVDKDLH